MKHTYIDSRKLIWMKMGLSNEQPHLCVTPRILITFHIQCEINHSNLKLKWRFIIFSSCLKTIDSSYISDGLRCPLSQHFTVLKESGLGLPSPSRMTHSRPPRVRFWVAIYEYAAVKTVFVLFFNGGRKVWHFSLILVRLMSYRFRARCLVTFQI